MPKKKPETILVTEIYINGRLVDKTTKVIRRGYDWLQIAILTVIILCGFWAMAMNGVFR